MALINVHVNPTKVSFSSLAVASDENEKHFTYLESSKMKRVATKWSCSQRTCCLLSRVKKGNEKDSVAPTIP